MSHGLALRLKQETATLHAEVERTGVMANLLRGEVSRGGYCNLLANLHALYAALESGLRRHAGHAALAPVCFPALYRTEALAADLNALAGDDWQRSLPTTATAQRYERRLHRLADTAPGLLAAHAYVRYLGDLHGGQVLARIVVRSLALENAAGTRFYRLGDAARLRELRARFRAGLDAIPADGDAADALVDEAKTAFQLHRDLFRELAGEDALAASP